ncbi:Microtubule-associated protein TORTIFOLIA1 [Spatholobus suberectus]|nr:Microtubule-associated protein TORTIFOLIA1 [Spatholobus suberectus]
MALKMFVTNEFSSQLKESKPVENAYITIMKGTPTIMDACTKYTSAIKRVCTCSKNEFAFDLKQITNECAFSVCVRADFAEPEESGLETQSIRIRCLSEDEEGTGQGGLELKQRIVGALNKVGDRDTQQIGMEELERMAQGLRAEGIWAFLSCILDTDWEQKAAIRKECIRLMGTLATYYKGLVLPHLPKMIASIVKRLRDPDSVVRDVCVNTAALLASKLVSKDTDREKVFVVLVRPIFEALGEQNKHVQSASALCLARIIDNTHHPPLSLLHKMLTRTLKLLKSPHFMAKPALLELTRSIIQAGGAQTQNILSAAIATIQDALKHSDWTTRKAASVSLAEIA